MSDDAVIKSFIDLAQMRQDIAINPTDLTTALQQHASLAVTYGLAAQDARRQHERWKTALELLEAKLDAEHRATLKEENPKTTEAQVRSAVVSDARWRSAQTRVIDAQHHFRQCEVVYSNFSQRGDMLLQMARDSAREMAGGSVRMQVVAGAIANGSDGRQRMLDKMQANRETATAST
jgi:hypothetical protein